MWWEGGALELPADQTDTRLRWGGEGGRLTLQAGVSPFPCPTNKDLGRGEAFPRAFARPQAVLLCLSHEASSGTAAVIRVTARGRLREPAVTPQDPPVSCTGYWES